MYFDSSKGPITIKTVCVDQSNNQITFKTIESIEQHLNKPDFLLQTILKWKLEDALIWNECKIAVSEPNQEAYEKKISLVKDPTFFQMLLPASGVKEFLSKLIEKYDTEFFYVKGKLPLHVNVTVANRNMPLYVLMESGRAAVAHPTEDRKSYEAMPICQSDTNTLDDFFGYGTTKAPWDSDFNVGHLTHGYPDQSGMVRQWGRFTTNFLKSSADRYKFPSISFTFDQLAAYKKCWEILSGLSSTQQQRLVGLLIEKDHWPNEEKAAKDAYQQMVMGYVGANLSPNVRDQFLKIGPQQILDTFNFYRLILKETSNDSRPTD